VHWHVESGMVIAASVNGQKLITLGGGERAFLLDGDEAIITEWCQGDGYRVGFGEVSGRIVPAHPADVQP
jgi:fumarylacetoacetase